MAFFIDQKQGITGIVPPSEIKTLIDYFYNFKNHIVTMGMRKITTEQYSQEVWQIIYNIVNRLGFSDYEILGDNFYEHTTSYFPHCDARQQNSWVNIVVPLIAFNTRAQQKFIVFDQKYITGHATWLGTFETKEDFVSNKKILSKICDTPGVVNSTGNEIDADLYDNMYTEYLPREYCFGLSGDIFDWIPGNAIVFDSKFIHTTGRMMCNKKLGLSIRLGHKQ